MLNSLSEQIRKCHMHAEHCVRLARVQIDLKLKDANFGNGAALADAGAELRVRATTNRFF
jgi:hypothetical protein